MAQSPPQTQTAFVHSAGDLDENGNVICACGEKAAKFTSHTEANPGRSFYRCETKHCKFWKWADRLSVEKPGQGSNGPSQTTYSSQVTQSSPRVLQQQRGAMFSSPRAQPSPQKRSRSPGESPSTPARKRVATSFNTPHSNTKTPSSRQILTPAQRAKRFEVIASAQLAPIASPFQQLQAAAPASSPSGLSEEQKASSLRNMELAQRRSGFPIGHVDLQATGVQTDSDTDVDAQEVEEMFWNSPPSSQTTYGGIQTQAVAGPSSISRLPTPPGSSQPELEQCTPSSSKPCAVVSNNLSETPTRHKGKERELPVERERIQSGPVNFHNYPISAVQTPQKSTIIGSTPSTPIPPTPTKGSFADEIGELISGLVTAPEKIRKLERALRGSQKSIECRYTRIKNLEQEVAKLKQENEIITGHTRQLEETLAHLRTRR